MTERPQQHPTFQHRPPNDAKDRLYKIERTPPTGKYCRTIISPSLTGTWTHYVDRRTTPCTHEGCIYCQQGASRRWHGYLQVCHPVTRSQAILELPSQTCITIDEWTETNGPLNGIELTAYRYPARSNGRVFVELRRPRELPQHLPPKISVEHIMERIWGIPSNGSGLTKSQIATEHKKHSPDGELIPARIGTSIDPALLNGRPPAARRHAD